MSVSDLSDWSHTGCAARSPTRLGSRDDSREIGWSIGALVHCLRQYRRAQSTFSCTLRFGYSCPNGPQSFAVVGLSTWCCCATSHESQHLLSPTEDLPVRQSICFISTLMTVISLLERVNITILYIKTTFTDSSPSVQYVLLLVAHYGM